MACQSDDKTVKMAFKRRGATIQWKSTLARLGDRAPFASPVAVTLSYGRAIDHQGTIGACTASSGGLSCRTP